MLTFLYTFKKSPNIHIYIYIYIRKKRAASSSACGGTANEEEQDLGWEFILEHGERDKGQLRQLRWIHKHINRDGIKGWSEKLVQRALDSLANDGCLASLTTRYDLNFQDFNPLFLEPIYEDAVGHLQDHSLWLLGEAGVGKTPLARATAMMFSRHYGGEGQFRSASDFDFFRGIPFNKATPALYDDGDVSREAIKKKKAFADVGDNEGILRERWTAAKFVKGQFRIVIDNEYVPLELSDPEASFVTHEDFVKMIRPAIGYISDADTRAILKRSVFIVFTKPAIYYRPPSEQPCQVKHLLWVLKDILEDDCKARFSNYKKDGPPTPDFDRRVATESAWLEEALRRHTGKHTVEHHFSNALPVPVVKMEPTEFAESHEGLAAICAGEALDSDSPWMPTVRLRLSGMPPLRPSTNQEGKVRTSRSLFSLAKSCLEPSTRRRPEGRH